jgi:predicted permease
MSIWRSSPFVAIVAVLALAMGIGFTTTMFSIVHGATRPLPFRDAHRLIALEKLTPRGSSFVGTWPFDYAAWSTATSFDALGAYESIEENFAGDGGDPERVRGVRITSNTFSMLGTAAVLGRALQVDDGRADAARVVVLSHGLWTRRFAADPGLIGRAIRLTGIPHVVVGIMPERFGFPVNAAFWTPLALDGRTWQPRSGPALQVFGRLADRASVDSSQAEIATLTMSAYRGVTDAETASNIRARVIPFQDVETPRDVIRGLYLLVVAVSFVLLIACANVANLLIARAAAHARDAALRLALGADRKRLVIDQLKETLSLALVAMVFGIAFAYGGTRLFEANTSHIIEAFWVDFRIDGVVLLFACGLAAAATIAAGLTPALRATRSNVADVLKDGAAGSSSLMIGRLSRWMIGGQVALACGLLALTMVLGRAAVNLRAVPWPYDPASIMTFEFELADGPRDDADRQRRVIEISRALNRTPGVAVAGLTTMLPGRADRGFGASLDRPAMEGDENTAVAALVSPEFFEVLGARALAGRLLTWADDAAAPRVAVVNASFVRRYSSDRDPVGRRLYAFGRDHAIVGVVPDLMARDIQQRDQDGVYVSLLQARPSGIRVMARGAANPASMMPSIRAALARVDPDMPLTEVFTLHEAVYREKRVLDVLSTLFLVFGIGALGMTAIGLYGIVSFAVTLRTRELGVRLALGATRAQVFRLVVGQGGRQLAAGIAAGMLLAVGLSRGFAAAVDALPPPDGVLLLWIAGAMSLTASVALIVPAQRAVRLQITRALKH